MATIVSQHMDGDRGIVPLSPSREDHRHDQDENMKRWFPKSCETKSGPTRGQYQRQRRRRIITRLFHLHLNAST